MPLIKTAARLAFRRGTKGGNRQMLMLSAVLGLASWARGRSKQPPKLLHREVLQPGESVRITVFDPDQAGG